MEEILFLLSSPPPWGDLLGDQQKKVGLLFQLFVNIFENMVFCVVPIDTEKPVILWLPSDKD